jgi:ABC-type transport system involved in Fe-S cluster assembly fused permease/ATPase subunit
MVAAIEKPPSERPGSAGDDTFADYLLRKTQYLYALTLLITFIGCAAWYSVYNAKREEDVVHSTVKGPGGKPLPITRRKKLNDGERKIGPHFGTAAKNVFRCLAAVVFLSYVATSSSMFVHAFWHEDPYRWSQDGLPWAGEWSVVHVTGSMFFHLYILISLFDWRKGPNIVHFFVWVLSFIGELTLFITTYIVAVSCHFLRSVRTSEPADDDDCLDHWTRTDLLLYFVRLLSIFGLIAFYCMAWVGKARRTQDRIDEVASSEATPLLNGHRRSYETQNGQEQNGRRRNRTISNASKAAGQRNQREEPAAFYRPVKIPHKTWWEYSRGYTLFFPYLWPKDSTILQFQVLVCFILVLIQRVVNAFVPLQIGQVVKKLEAAVKDVEGGGLLTVENFPLKDFAILGVLWILQGQSGLLGSLRTLLWIPVSQYSYRGLTTAAFNHVHSLSLDFHLSKRTGEVLSALNKGSSINQFLEQVTFSVIPMLFDLFLAISVLYYKYGVLYAEINLIDTCWYLYMTIKMASTRADQRREMTNADREEEAVKNDSISSYETVKYFNAEEYESNRYQDRVAAFQTAEAKVQMGMVMMNICQTILFNLGRIIAATVCGWQVAVGVKDTGDWFAIVSYLTQLQGPLNFFGTFYRTVQQAMISGERLLELFKIQPTVVDTPHAKPLENFQGRITWNNVCFAYDRRRPALRNISFECPPGTTTAFVGESGGGKSTLFRHMFRYYDTDEGSIELDGQNVKDLTIASVRRHIGVVPQDTALFNETIMYNLKYANPDATEEQVIDACKAASIHDRIMSFPDKYESQVGERGLRLSGGEKQRVAIARTILKDPRIIMLDEATSALDSHTEQEIQENVWSIGQGRTLLVIAHRLSTITHADQIIVLHAGEIVERGTHEDLLSRGGAYASMWEKQIRAERARSVAARATLKAERASRKANMPSLKHPESSDNEYSGDPSPGSISGKSDCNSEQFKPTESTSSSSSNSGHDSSQSSSDAESSHNDRPQQGHRPH